MGFFAVFGPFVNREQQVLLVELVHKGKGVVPLAELLPEHVLGLLTRVCLVSEQVCLHTCFALEVILAFKGRVG